MTSLRKMISVSFMVRSSSLVPDFRSLTTDGRMQRGGTRRRVMMRSAGLPASGFISSRGMSSSGILLNRFRTTRGFRFSWKKILYILLKEAKRWAVNQKNPLTCARFNSGSISLLCSMAVSKDCMNSDTNGSTTFLVVLYFSWMIFNRPHFFTVPLKKKCKKTFSFFFCFQEKPELEVNICLPLKAEQFRQTVLLRHFSEIFFFKPRFWR